MTALIDVDRPVGSFLTPRPGRRTPSGGCPPWCRLAPGHPFLAETPDGPRLRHHESVTLGVGAIGPGTLVEARLVAYEECTRTGQRSLSEARIVLDGVPAQGWASLSADEARSLGVLLETAAAALGRSVRRVA